MRSTCSSALALTVAALALPGCFERGAPAAPVVLEVSPDWAFNTAPVVLTVEGDHFSSRGAFALSGASSADDTYELWVGAVALEEVSRTDMQHLSGRLPAGVDPGTYALRLIDPWRREVTLPEALTIRARRGAVLRANASAPASVQTGNTLEVTVELTNDGDTAVEEVALGPATAAGPAVVALFQSSPSVVIEPGQTVRHTLLFRTSLLGQVRLSWVVAGIDGLSRQRVEVPVSAGPVTVVSPPVLAAVVTAQPNPVAVGQTLALTAEVSNAGLGAVTDFLPTAVLVGNAGFRQLTTPVPRGIMGTGREAFTFSFEATLPGDATFLVDGRGSSSETGLPAFVTPASTNVRVLRPPALSATVMVSPTSAEVGEVLTLSVAVQNGGEEDADQLTVTVAATGSGQVTPLSTPAPQIVPANGNVLYLLAFEASAPGPVQFEAMGAALSLQGRRPVTFRIVGGDAVIAGVAMDAGAPIDAGAADAGTGMDAGTVVDAGAPTDAGARTDAGTPTDAGVPMDAGTWMDAGTPADAGAPRDAGASMDAGASSDAGGPSDAGGSSLTDGGVVTRIALDPFAGDGTRASHVVYQNGFVHVGPSLTGGNIARLSTSGQFDQTLPFSVSKDLSGTNTMSNSQPGPFANLGSPGCSSTSCGPDTENHRIFMFGGDFDGFPTLVFGPSKTSGNLKYAYVGFAGLLTTPLSWVDLSRCIPAGSTAYTSGHSFKGRLYFALSNNGSARPGLVKLSTRPTMGGLDAAPFIDCENLQARLMPGLAGGSPGRIDAIGSFNDRLYVANGNAWYRSTNDNPRPFDTYPTDWVAVTPVAAAYTSRPSRVSAKDVSFDPSDLAVPHFAAFDGRLFAGRNTTTGPQLWSCNPALTSSTTDCDAGDWQLIAPNSVGDVFLSQFNASSDLQVVTMVEATANFLYVGYNSASGFRVYRTSNAAATQRADFRGDANCNADRAPIGCEPLGGAGFGDLDNDFIYSATPFRRFSSEGVLLLVGRASVPTRVFRIDD